MYRVKAFLPPQGILVIAGYLPKNWDVRLVDENMGLASDDDFRWADVVLVTGMHAQRQQIRSIIERAHGFGKLTVLGGPSVSACPEWYPNVDILHIGELGDATDRLLTRLDSSVSRPRQQEIFTTEKRLPLAEFPMPAYHLINLTDYFLASIQFSSGCPFQCEFCDIPELYGRAPRLKTPQQVTAELDAMLARGNPGAVYFVDDNFIANPKAATELLAELAKWQKERGYPVQFACEATLNLAQAPATMELMREAYFCTIFCGIESPEEDALNLIQKKHNLRKPILDEVRTLNSYGLEVVSGIILGLDTDSQATGDRVSAFVRESRIPMLTINMLHALPKTPLWRRLETAGRILRDTNRESNVEFLLPYEEVVAMWLKCISESYTPEAIYARFQHQIQNTFPKRKQLPVTRARVNAPNIWKGLNILARILWHVGVWSDYRSQFWRMAIPCLLRLKIEEVIHTAVVSHHMIEFSRECAKGEAEKCFYGDNIGDEDSPGVPAEKKTAAPSPGREALVES
jgi:radical SAM superfamily enzyme YgiQ (UPF0313 family)